MSGRRKGKTTDTNPSKDEDDKDDDSFDEEDEVPLSKLVAQKAKNDDSNDEEDEIPLSKLVAQKAKKSESNDNKKTRVLQDSVKVVEDNINNQDDSKNDKKEKEKDSEKKPDENTSAKDKATTATATTTQNPKPDENDKIEAGAEITSASKNPGDIKTTPTSKNPGDIKHEKDPATDENKSNVSSDDGPSTTTQKEEKESKPSAASETKESTTVEKSKVQEDADGSSEKDKSSESKVEMNENSETTLAISASATATATATEIALESTTGEKSTMKEDADGSSEKNKCSESQVEVNSSAETTTVKTTPGAATEESPTNNDPKKDDIKVEAGTADSSVPQTLENEGEIQKEHFKFHTESASKEPTSKKSATEDSLTTPGGGEKKKVEEEPTSSTTAQEAKTVTTNDVEMKPPDAGTKVDEVSMTDAEVTTKDANETLTTETNAGQGNDDPNSEDKRTAISIKQEKAETQIAAASGAPHLTTPALPAASGDVSSNKEIPLDTEKPSGTEKTPSSSGGPTSVPLETCVENSTRRERKPLGDNKSPKGPAKKSETTTPTISTEEESTIGSKTTGKTEDKVKSGESLEVDKSQGKDKETNDPQTSSSDGSSGKPAATEVIPGVADTKVSTTTTMATEDQNLEIAKITEAEDPMEIDFKESNSQLPEAMDVDTPPGTEKQAPAPDKSHLKSESAPAGVPKSELGSGSKAGNGAATAQTKSDTATALGQDKSPVDANKPIREIPTWIVESESEDEEDGTDPFQAFTNQKLSVIDNIPARKKLKVSFTKETNTKIEKLKKSSNETMNTAVPNSILQLDDARFLFNDLEPDTKEHLEDSLIFFRVPHEDQDPAFAKFEDEQKQKEVEGSLKKIEQEDLEGRKQIESYVSQLFKEKQASTDRSVEKYKQKATADLQKDMQRLHQIYKEKSQSNQDKINQGMQVLRKRHQTELQRVMQQHRQQVQQRRIPEQMASSEWTNVSNRLHAKHQKQLQEFSAKGEEVKTRCEAEYQRDQTKLRSQHEKRHNDIEQNRKNVHSRFYQGIQQLRQRYLKRHVQKIMKQKEALTSSRKKDEPPSVAHAGDDVEPSKESSRSKNEEKAELRPPSPIKTSLDWCKDSTCRKSGGAARHKHRKGVLSQTQKQLSVEIHNEGLWIKKIPIKDEVDKSKKKEADTDPNEGDKEKKRFIPWGVKAREALESIIMGEIPHGIGMDVFDLTESTTATGGHVRCVMTDLRTSEETASSQRKLAVVERAQVELIELDKKAKKAAAELSAAHSDLARLQNEEKDAATKMQIAQKDSMDKKANVSRFREKFGSYLGPDDKPLPTTNPSDRQKLMAASMKYKTAASAAIKKENESSKKLAEAKLASQKQEAIVKQKQDEAASAANNLKKRTRPEADEMNHESDRIADIISAFDYAANKRRDQLDKKRHSNTSSAWVHTLPGVPGPLRRSLWYKMHRRRQQIVLRPSPESIILGLRNHVERNLKAKGLSIPPVKTENGSKAVQTALEEAQLRAEQQLLLAIHPVLSPDEKLLSTPSSSSSSAWAEPGWHLELQVPKHKTMGILPRADLPPLVQRNLSEIHSAPGQQAAALVRRAHLRSLESPLSSVAIATSLGETNPTVSISPAAEDTKPESDPLHVSEEMFERGYKFTIKEPPPPKPLPVVAAPPLPVIATKPPPAMQRKKSVTNKPQIATQPSSKGAPKRKVSATASTLNLPTPTSVAPTPASAQPEKKRKTSTASRPTQRKKVEPKQPAASHARTTKQQPQRQKQPRQQKPRQQPQQQQQRNLQQQQPKPYMQQAPTQQAQQQQFYQQQQQGPPQMQPMPQAPTQQQQYQRFMMMQQQQHQSQQNANPDQFGQMQQPPNPGYPQPPRGMQQMPPQFYQQFAVQQPMGMPGPNMPGGPPVAPGPPGGLPMNLQGNPVRQNPPPDDQNDPLFLL